ncbi:insecticidal delta-endotoxin Cry8Ea1 family protein [Burkholderia pyrrocinia]
MRKGKLNRRQFMLYSGATLLFPTFPACGGGEPTSTSVNIPNVREAVDNENLGALAGFIDFDKLIPPGFKDAVSNFEKEIVAGIGAGIDPSAFVNAENPLEAVVPVLELIATSAASAIPGVGFVVSGVLSVIFQWVNDSMKNKADMNAIIHKIVNQAIEDNNFRMMQLSVEGMHNQLTDYIGLLQARMPLLIAGAGGQISPLDPTVAETIKEKADGINTYIEGEIPKFLIKGSEIHGVPLYAHVAALGGNLYVDFLRQRDLLGNALSQQDFLRIYNEVETQLFRHQQRLAEVVRDYGKSKGFIEYNRFINGLYQFSSYGFLLNVIKKRHEALYRKRIRIRTSMELYECGVSDDIDYMAAVVRTNLPERVSMMTSLHGYSHRGDYPLIQRLNQAFVSADGKPLTDYQQSCVGAVGDGPDYETFIDVNFPTAEFGGMPVGNGFSIPSKVAVWQFGSTGAAPGTPRAITIADQGDTQRFLGQKLPLDGGGLFDHFSAVGYYLSGFLTAQGGGEWFWRKLCRR